jgi:hypothetical protein
MTTHLSIYQGNCEQIPTGTSNPTTRELAEYLVGNDTDLQDGDWYYNTTTNNLAIYIGSTWYFISFTSK